MSAKPEKQTLVVLTVLTPGLSGFCLRCHQGHLGGSSWSSAGLRLAVGPSALLPTRRHGVCTRPARVLLNNRPLFVLALLPHCHTHRAGNAPPPHPGLTCVVLLGAGLHRGLLWNPRHVELESHAEARPHPQGQGLCVKSSAETP